MKTSILALTLIFLFFNNLKSFDKTDKINLEGLWRIDVTGNEKDYKYEKISINDGKKSIDFLPEKKPFFYYLLIDKNLKSYILLKFSGSDSSFYSESVTKKENLEHNLFQFSRFTVTLNTVTYKEISLTSEINLDSSYKILCSSVSQKISGYDEGLKIFRDNMDSLTKIENRRQVGKDGFLSIQSKNMDLENFRLSLDILPDKNMESVSFYSVSLMNFATEKLSDGGTIYSTNFFLWAPFLGLFTTEYLIDSNNIKSPDWAIICLTIIDIPQMLLNSYINFPIHSDLDYFGAVIGIHTDWYFFAHDNSGDFCFEPRIGLRYLYHKSIGFEVNGNYPLWTNGDNIMRKFPYLGLDINVGL